MSAKDDISDKELTEFWGRDLSYLSPEQKELIRELFRRLKEQRSKFQR